MAIILTIFKESLPFIIAKIPAPEIVKTTENEIDAVKSIHSIARNSFKVAGVRINKQNKNSHFNKFTGLCLAINRFIRIK